MHPSNKLFLLILWVLLFSCHHGFPLEVDTLYSNQSIHNGQILTSAQQLYMFGFFRPNNSSENRYLGIWTKNFSRSDEKIIMWVANRDDPLTHEEGVVKFDEVTSNLLLIDAISNRTIWSTNTTVGANGNVTAKLQNYGNLALLTSDGGEVWSSFDHLTNAFLPKSELSFDFRTKKNNTLTSWKSKSDPSLGSFLFVITRSNLDRGFVINGSKPYFRLGPWIGGLFICVPDMPSSELFRYNLSTGTENEDVIRFKYVVYYEEYVPMMLILEPDGRLIHLIWSGDRSRWDIDWEKPGDKCDIYGYCGQFATCDTFTSDRLCKCMSGFEPRSSADWEKGNFSGGCVRERELACERNAGGNIDSGDYRFLKQQELKLPDGELLRNATDESHCLNLCREDCKCLAYAYVKKQYCLVWNGDLLDVRVIEDGQDLYVKLDPSGDSSTGKGYMYKVVLPSTVGAVLGIIAFCILLLRHIRRKRALQEEDESITSLTRTADDQELVRVLNNSRPETKDMVFHQYSLRIVVTATDDFSLRNKLGEGGFGSVYKGVLPGGQEIAVKRLSKRSTQGLKEFENEVLLISKLQHQNLVRLLGYCVNADEKLLIYEFLPKGSLNAYLFGSLKEELLDWSKRFQIIEAISRGILYLHRDSRLKIIHRDLKASNILLDADLNPKISDFGTARIFGDSQTLETNTVVGTLGYMPPEYMVHGHFSEKSDVYSFGVLLLEIISSARVGTFYDELNSLNLLGHAWKLWNEGNAFDLIDRKLRDSWPHSNAVKCITVALLCVQAHASERPTMSSILTMLTSDNLDLPSPREPPFIAASDPINLGSSGRNHRDASASCLTVTGLEGR